MGNRARGCVGALLAVLMGCGGSDGGDADGGGGGGGSVAGVSGGTSNGSLSSVSLACVTSASGSPGDLMYDCSFGADPPQQGVAVTVDFVADYADAPAGTVLVQGTDFTVLGLSYYAMGGFGAGGVGTVLGEMTITLGARTTTTAATFEGELRSSPDSPAEPFTLTFDAVPAALP